MLYHLITSRSRRKLLKIFFSHPDKRFYLRELEKKTGENINSLKRELSNLLQANLLKSYKEGNIKYYEINKDFPLYLELKRIVYKTIGLNDYLKEKLASYDSIKLALIFGSIARNEERRESDIDLLIVGEISDDELSKTISAIEKDVSREINYLLMSQKEFLKRKKEGEPLLKRILTEEKIILKEDLNVSG
jgi:predicted nucleotidyltransferase